MIAITAMGLTFYNIPLKEMAWRLAVIIVPALLLCAMWPYYSFTALVTGGNAGFHEISKSLYSRPLGIYWPAVLALPAAWFIKKDKALNFLFLAIGCMLLLFVTGYLSGSYGLSRIMSCCMLFAQLVIAYTVVTLVNAGPKLWARVYVWAVLLLFIISIARNRPGLEATFDLSKPADLNYYKRYEFLRTAVPADAVILSDLISNWYIPSFNAKVIASVHPLFLVTDHAERQNDVNVFFNAGTPVPVKEKIIAKYGPAYVLIDLSKHNLNAAHIAWLEDIGSTVYNKDSLQLIRLNSINN